MAALALFARWDMVSLDLVQAAQIGTAGERHREDLCRGESSEQSHHHGVLVISSYRIGI